MLFGLISLASASASRISHSESSSARAPDSMVLKSFTLCLASTVISITSVLNFSLAATLVLLLGLPLTAASPTNSSVARLLKFSLYSMLALGWLVFTPGEVAQALKNWEILGVWFAPFVCIVYTPLVLQAGIVTLLS